MSAKIIPGKGMPTTPIQQQQDVSPIQNQAPAQQKPIIGDGELVPGAQKVPEKNDKPLDADQLRMVAGVGGVGIKGPGQLAGTLAIESRRVVEFGIARQEDVAVLVTANRGKSDQVGFALDIPVAEAKKFVNQDLAVSGNIDKLSATQGTIKAAKIDATDGFAFGSWLQLSGTVENREPMMGIGGEAPPSGSFLKLDTPINIGGAAVKELLVEGRMLTDGAQVNVTGRLDQRTWGGVERGRQTYAALSGVTNQSAGEPTFDGKSFQDSAGKPMETFRNDAPLAYDGNAQIFVVDQGADKVWQGAERARMDPRVGLNPFLGIQGSAPLETATPADRARIGFDPQGTPFDKGTNQKYDLLSESRSGSLSSSWYRNPSNGELLKFLSGGFTGGTDLTQIVRPQASAPRLP